MSKKETKTNAMRILERMKIPYERRTYECDEFTDGIHVADLLVISYETMYKTLVTVGKSKAYYVFVIPIAEEIDFKKAAKSLPIRRKVCAGSAFMHCLLRCWRRCMYYR